MACSRQSLGSFPKPCRRAAASIPRGNGIRPQSTFARGFRTRGFKTTGFGGSYPNGVPGFSTRMSTASIRHIGRNMRTACGAAINSSIISGVCKIACNWPPWPAARQPAFQTIQPNCRGQATSGFTRAGRTSAAGTRTTVRALNCLSLPAWNRATSSSIRLHTKPNLQ